MSQVQKNCSACTKEIGIFLKAKHTCYLCKMQFCKDCSPKQVIVTRLELNTAEPICLNCLQQFTQQEIEDWTKSGLNRIEVGTVKSTKAAINGMLECCFVP